MLFISLRSRVCTLSRQLVPQDSVMLEMLNIYTVQYGGHWPHVAIELLKCKTEFLFHCD